ncbi:MAG: hypothetical protein SNJ66_14355 [Chloroherpetonaceae bacterium]
MKRHILFLAGFILFCSLSVQAVAHQQPEAFLAKGSVKIVNDTKQDVHIYTGTGHVRLTHGGGSTSVSCENGKEICFSNKGKKGSVIFTIDASMCGKTVKLSSYLK